MAERIAESGGKAVIVDAAEEPRNWWTAERLGRLVANGSVSIFRARIEKISRPDLLDFVRECDGCFHFAAHTGIPHSSKDPDDDWVSNVDVTRHLLEAVRISGRTDFPLVMTSSVKPYRTSGIPAVEEEERFSWAPAFAGVNEDFPLDPDEPYAASKMAQSALGIAYSRTYGIPVCVLRCSNLYGDAPCHGPRHGWLTWFCISAVLGRAIEIQGTGKQTRDMLFSDDVATAAMAALRSREAMSGSVYNLGGGPGNTVSCLEAVSAISEILGRRVPSSPGPGRKNEDMLFVTDSSRFSSLTGWSPSVRVRDGIKRILDWAEKNAESLAEVYREA